MSNKQRERVSKVHQLLDDLAAIKDDALICEDRHFFRELLLELGKEFSNTEYQLRKLNSRVRSRKKRSGLKLSDIMSDFFHKSTTV